MPTPEAIQICLFTTSLLFLCSFFRPEPTAEEEILQVNRDGTCGYGQNTEVSLPSSGMNNTWFFLWHMTGGSEAFSRLSVLAAAHSPSLYKAQLWSWCVASVACPVLWSFCENPQISTETRAGCFHQSIKTQLIYHTGSLQFWIWFPPLSEAQSRVCPPWSLVAPAASKKDWCLPVPDTIHTWGSWDLMVRLLSSIALGMGMLQGRYLQRCNWRSLAVPGTQKTLTSLYCQFPLHFKSTFFGFFLTSSLPWKTHLYILPPLTYSFQNTSNEGLLFLQRLLDMLFPSIWHVTTSAHIILYRLGLLNLLFYHLTNHPHHYLNMVCIILLISQ